MLSHVKRTSIPVALLLLTSGEYLNADVSLKEAADGTVYRTIAHAEITGNFHTPAGDGQATRLSVKSTADYDFHEMRIAGSGPGTESLRSVRYYHRGENNTEVAKRKTSSRLSSVGRVLVARGQPDGIQFFSTSTLLTRPDLDLLSTPADPLLLSGLLPRADVEIGERWNPDKWVIQVLTGVEAVVESEMTCQLKSVDNGVAIVSIVGTIKGATLGVSSEVAIAGQVAFNVAGKYIGRVELRQQEKRSVGPVSPGMDVTVAIVWNRRPDPNQRVLTTSIADRIPVNPSAHLLDLSYQASWNARFVYDRNWHVFHETDSMSILRRIEQGAMVAQCSVTKIASVAAGQHTPTEQFQTDIQQALGNQFRAVEAAGVIPTDDRRYLYRVVVTGVAKGQPMTWVYYLCTAPTGQQCSFVFSVSSGDKDRLADHDLKIVRSLEFLNGPTVRRAATP